ncbi:zinc-ribbon domain-containing protein [Bifidobacterium leontopitheci]|uniref:Zinc-ribbon domain-containing protein n=1 Tax=Bifidobacterium leontopitheci TaxID=2650774 RepID=A0A6I1GID3_9BIFI|nr:zinc-ribbon domain-containing protein [Bifidobacterium leontopitheci]KAB7791444.1 hypothetical protein F7D09_0119 [Bifidobacterium leontopitheci]
MTNGTSTSNDGAESALAENHMKVTPPVTPDAWNISQCKFVPMAMAALFEERWKFAAAVIPVIGIIAALYYGLKPAGSYYGYTAGSILQPDRYTDYGTGDVWEMYGYMSADQLNKELGDLRAQNLPGFIGWLLVAVISAIGLLAALGAAYDRSVTTAATMLTNDDAMYRFFRDRYEELHGTYKPKDGFLDDILHLPYTIAGFSYEWLLTPGNLSRYPDAPISDAYQSAICRQARWLSGRVYLLYNDLWLDPGTGNVKRIFGKSDIPAGTLSTAAATQATPAVPIPAASATTAPTPVTAVPTPVTAVPAPVTAVPAPTAHDTTEPASTAPTPGHAPVPLPTAAPVPMPNPTQGTAPTIAPAVPLPASPAPNMLQFCTQCGTKLRPGINFCPQCGAKLQ